MKLTPFGEETRILRMRYDISMKDMAEQMTISPSHLSGIEYGEKRLLAKHIKGALSFFEKKGVTAEELDRLLSAAEKSKDTINTSGLTPDAKGLVAAFARRLEAGDHPTPEMMNWIESKKG